LFKGPRPAISSAPSQIQYGASFSVSTPDASRIASVSLIAPGAVTHAYNQNQRFVPLTFGQISGGLNIQAPVDGNLAPPGPYMLFLVDTNGVPSVASWVRLSGAAGDTQPPTAPTNLRATVRSATQIDLSWTASTDNVAVSNYKLQSCQGAGCTNFAPLVTITGVNYTNAGLTASTTYRYRVRARDAAGNLSPFTPVVTATTLAAPP